MAITGSDTPVTDGAIFGTDPGAFYSSGAQGSTGADAPTPYNTEAQSLGMVRVTSPYESVAGQLPPRMTEQTTHSTNASSDPLDAGLGTGSNGSAAWGSLDGSSHVTGPSHPNAGR